MEARGSVFKYGDNIDTDVIIPARYLNTQNARELADHCMEDIDKTFITRVQAGDQLCPHLLPQRHQHRPAHPGVPGGKPGHPGGGHGVREL